MATKTRNIRLGSLDHHFSSKPVILPVIEDGIFFSVVMAVIYIAMQLTLLQLVFATVISSNLVFCAIWAYPYTSRRNSGSIKREDRRKRRLCGICTNGRVNIALIPCMHTYFCKSCYDAYTHEQLNMKCPICRANIDNTIERLS